VSAPSRMLRPMGSRWRTWLRWALAAFMVGVGVLHFTAPDFFVKIVPDYLPAHVLLVMVSGVFEILGGVGILVPRARKAASFGLVALYLAVFPANVNMLLHPEIAPDVPLWVLWARLPLQGVLIAWALWVGRGDAEGR
jgi:uncharacterized membrane protein